MHNRFGLLCRKMNDFYGECVAHAGSFLTQSHVLVIGQKFFSFRVQVRIHTRFLQTYTITVFQEHNDFTFQFLLQYPPSNKTTNGNVYRFIDAKILLTLLEIKKYTT